jgi:hypothetical protein
MALVVGGAVVATSGHAESVVLAPTKDNSIFSERAGNSNGIGPSLFVGHTAPETEGGGVRRSLIAFDPLAAGILPGSVIHSVAPTLFFEQSGAGFRPGKTIALHRVTADWGEGDSLGGGGQGVAAEPGDATWNDRLFGEIPWTMPGGDFVATPSSSLLVPNEDFDDLNTFHTWPSTPELLADVQAWVDAPGCNFGWILIGDEVGNRTSARFTSRNNEFFPENRPTLAIEYSPPPARLDGDIDFDGDVDRDDAALLAANLGRDNCVTMNDGDFTFDGAVGLADLLLLQSNIGRTFPPPGPSAAVPEPRSLVLGVFTLALSWLVRRRMSH